MQELVIGLEPGSKTNNLNKMQNKSLEWKEIKIELFFLFLLLAFHVMIYDALYTKWVLLLLIFLTKTPANWLQLLLLLNYLFQLPTN